MALHDPQPLDAGPEETGAGDRPRPLATFGGYLLFRRLKRDELGEVYRAGRLGASSIERMVLLRLFNAAEIDGERFWQACQGRIDLRPSLQGGPFAEVVDLGCESGVAFVAYELVLGRSLAELLAQGRERSQPAALSHTLHVLDRIAVGLQNAHEIRLHEKRIVHGFLIPDFVHVSSEGEIRLAGFESTGGLLDLSPTSQARTHLAGYLSPEVNAGKPPSASDDVYSMASIFAELLTGEPVPALDPAETGCWVDAATLAAEGSPLPDDIRRLLRDSLLPREERIQTAEQWRRTLAEIAAGAGRSSTTFDVAFFMHTLFGDAIEQEANLMEAEMRAEIPPPAPLPAAEAAAPEAPTEPEAEAAAAAAAEDSTAPAPPEGAVVTDGEAAAEGTFEVAAEPPKAVRRSSSESRTQAAPAEKTGRWWLVAAVAAVLLLGLGAAYYFFFGPASRRTESPAPLMVEAATRLDEAASGIATVEPQDALSGIAEVAPPLSPEELESQVRSLVAERAGDLEANLKAEYDQRLVELRRQLEAARKAAPAAPAPATAATPPPAQPAPAESESKGSSSPASKTVAPAPSGPRVEPEPEAETPTATAEPADTKERPAVPVARNEIAGKPEPPPVEAPAELAAATVPEPQRVEAGSIVVNGPGVTAPTLERQPRAVYPPAAARLKRQATVRVRILVDEQGKPSEIEQLGKKVGLGFDAAALQAARTTRWSPPTKNGVPVKMWVELSIDFRQ